MHNKKPILVVTTSFPTLASAFTHGFIGGAPFLLTECRALLCAGYTLKILMPMHKGLEPCEKHDGLTIIRFTYPLMRYNPSYWTRAVYGEKSFLSKISLISMALFFIWHIYRLTHKGEVGLIWANWLQVGFLARLANRRQLPLLVTLRGSDVRRWPKKVVRLMARFASDVLNMYQDDSEIQGWIEEYGFRELAVPNVYASKVIPRPQELRTMKNVMIIGRLDGEHEAHYFKGMGENLFIVLAKLLAKRNDFRVTVIGTGRRVETFQHILAGFDGRVEFTGWLQDFSQYLAVAYCVLGGGALNGVIMDTVPYGIPVLISKHTQGRLWKDRHNCVMYDPDDLQAFQSSIEFALDHAVLIEQYAQRARQALDAFALPIEKAAELWAKRLEAFCSGVQSR